MLRLNKIVWMVDYNHSDVAFLTDLKEFIGEEVEDIFFSGVLEWKGLKVFVNKIDIDKETS